MTKARLGALNVLADPMLTSQRGKIAGAATAAGLPSVGWQADYAEAGGLIAYGPSFRELHRDAAAYVAKILAGAKPADLPVEQPTKFDLVINLRDGEAAGYYDAAVAAAKSNEGNRSVIFSVRFLRFIRTYSSAPTGSCSCG